MGLQWLYLLRTLKTFILLKVFIVSSIVETGDIQHGIFVNRDPPDFYGLQKEFRGFRYIIPGSRYLTYNWYHNGTLINKLYMLQFIGFNEEHLQVIPSDVDQRYQGIYQLFIKSPFGEIFGRKIRVKFRVFGKFTSNTDLEKRQVVIGQPYSLSCPEHTYSTDCLYKWGMSSRLFGLQHIEDTARRVVLDNGTLILSSVTHQDLKEFRKGINCILECTWCFAVKLSHRILLYSGQENTSSHSPKIVTALENQEVLLGAKYLKITCAATGSPHPSYRWIKVVNGVDLDVVHQENYIHVGPYGHSLKFYNIKKSHNGTYVCVVTSGDKEERTQGNIVVREKPSWSPEGLVSSQSLDVFTNLTWMCKANGDPKPIVTWYANTTRMSSTSGRYKINGGNITFSSLLVTDSGMYQCVGENRFGSIYQTVALHVRAQKPNFLQKIRSEVLLIENKGVLTCQSKGIPSPEYSWFKDDDLINFTVGGKYELQRKRDLVIGEVSYEDTGLYKCVASNVFGRDELTINVTIGDIRFETAPKSTKRIGHGEMFSLFCEATSHFQIKYRWKFDNTELVLNERRFWSIHAHRLVTQYANESDSGVYECVAYIDHPGKLEKTKRALVIVEGPPRALRGFRLRDNCTNNSAFLSWEILDIYNYTETYVIIEFRMTRDSTVNLWQRFGREKYNASLGWAHVRDLTSWSKIQFRGIPVNEFGQGLPSASTSLEQCETPATAPTKCPESFHGIHGSSETIVMKWKKIEAVDIHGPEFKYELKYRKFGQPMWSNVTLNETMDHFTLSNTGVNKLWIFTIQTKNNIGHGPTCAEESIYSENSKPHSLLGLKVDDIQATSVVVKWSVRPDQKQHIDGFKLEYWRSAQERARRDVNSDECGTSTHPCQFEFGQNVNKHRILDLIPLTYHNVSLEAYNSVGEGPKEYIAFQTIGLTGARRATPSHRQNWFITVLSLTCFLVIAMLIIFLLRRRGERYPVRKRENKKGGFPYATEFPNPVQDFYVNHVSYPSLQKLDEPEDEDDLNSVFLNDDDYDEDAGSFIGEYSNKTPVRRQLEERFV